MNKKDKDKKFRQYLWTALVPVFSALVVLLSFGLILLTDGAWGPIYTILWVILLLSLFVGMGVLSLYNIIQSAFFYFNHTKKGLSIFLALLNLGTLFSLGYLINHLQGV